MENTERKAAQIYQMFSDALIDRAKGQVKVMAEMRWEAGDLAAELREELSEDDYSQTAIWIAVGRLYEVSWKTVRSWERVARIVTPDMREDAGLSFEYFRAMCGAPVRDGAGGYMDEGDFRRLPEEERYARKRERVEGLCLEIESHVEAWGSMPSIEQVWGWGRENDQVKSPWVIRLENDIARADQIIEDENTPPVLRAYYGVHRGVIKRFLDTGTL